MAERLTLPGLLRRNAAERGAVRALVTEDDALTHAELDGRSRALAARLAAADVGKGARVGVVLPNGIDWAVLACATWRLGGVLVPLSTLLRPPELAAQLRTAGVTHLVVAEAFRGRSYLDDVEAVGPGWRDGERHPAVPSLRAVWTEVPAEADAGRAGALEARVVPADDLCVLFTSGSRGAPKGTVHTHGGALGAVAAGLADRCIGPDDRLYIPMPFFWTGGLAGGLLSVLVAGATLVTEAVPEPDRTLALLERERVTLFRGWPDQAARLATHPGVAAADLSSLGDGSLPAVLPAERRPAPGARANLFGMTETFGPYCGARADADLPEGTWGSCGRPFDGVEVRVVDGELAVRGPNVLRAICGRTRAETFDADGWYRTGDLGTVDGDGYVWYSGRVDDMFKVKGATVYPTEVEAALRGVDGVRSAHVTDVDGEVGALVVSARPVAELAAEARARLSAFKVPTRWLVAPTAEVVPMTATAKVDRAALQALLQREGAGG